MVRKSYDLLDQPSVVSKVIDRLHEQMKGMKVMPDYSMTLLVMFSTDKIMANT